MPFTFSNSNHLRSSSSIDPTDVLKNVKTNCFVSVNFSTVEITTCWSGNESVNIILFSLNVNWTIRKSSFYIWMYWSQWNATRNELTFIRRERPNSQHRIRCHCDWICESRKIKNENQNRFDWLVENRILNSINWIR